MCRKMCYYNDMVSNKQNNTVNYTQNHWDDVLKEAQSKGASIEVSTLYDLGANYTQILEKLHQVIDLNISLKIVDAESFVVTIKTLRDVITYLDATQPNNADKRIKGIERARAKGVKFGRPAKTKELKKAHELVQAWKDAGLKPNIQRACKLAGITRAAYYKHYGKEE